MRKRLIAERIWRRALIATDIKGRTRTTPKKILVSSAWKMKIRMSKTPVHTYAADSPTNFVDPSGLAIACLICFPNIAVSPVIQNVWNSAMRVGYPVAAVKGCARVATPTVAIGVVLSAAGVPEVGAGAVARSCLGGAVIGVAVQATGQEQAGQLTEAGWLKWRCLIWHWESSDLAVRR